MDGGNMNEDKSFIKLHRKMIKWCWYDNINTTRLFIHLLLIANWEDKEWHDILVKRGQVITGRKKLSKETGLTEQQIRTSLTKLVSTQEITIKKTNKYSIITINNYDLYQTNNQQITSNQPTNNQQITTTKEYKNIRNNNSSSIYEFVEENLGRTLSPIEYEKIADWKDTELTRYAIKKAILNGKYSIGYINGILNNYKKNNIITVQQAQREEQEFKNNKSNNKSVKKENTFMKVLKGVDNGTIILK